MKIMDNVPRAASRAQTIQDRAMIVCLALGCLCAVLLLILTFVSYNARVDRLWFIGAFSLIALHFALRRDQSRLQRTGWAIMAALQVALYFANR